MLRFPAFVYYRIKCNFPVLVLAYLWFLGLFLGYRLQYSSGNSTTLIYSCVSLPLTLTGLFISVALPFVLCVFAASFRLHFLLYLIVFFKAFFLGFSLAGVCFAFGSAGWLIRTLFMFSDLFASPIFLLFIYRRIFGYKNLRKDCFLISSVLLIISIFDYVFVSPFLVMLMNHL